MKPVGKFYGVGVGPGDPELLTLKAVRILEEVDWIFMPASSSGEPGFAARIIASLQLGTERFRPVTLSMSRVRDADVQAYTRAAQDILTELRAGRSAAWITEGDPLFYGTFTHLWTALQELDPNIPVAIVPGITSIAAAAACVQVPIARLDETVAVVPAAYGLHHLADLLDKFSTVFLLKVHGVFEQLIDTLATLARQPQAYYVEKVGTPQERIVRDLGSLRGERLPYFSLVILRK